MKTNKGRVHKCYVKEICSIYIEISSSRSEKTIWSPVVNSTRTFLYFYLIFRRSGKLKEGTRQTCRYRKRQNCWACSNVCKPNSIVVASSARNYSSYSAAAVFPFQRFCLPGVSSDLPYLLSFFLCFSNEFSKFRNYSSLFYHGIALF